MQIYVDISLVHWGYLRAIWEEKECFEWHNFWKKSPVIQANFGMQKVSVSKFVYEPKNILPKNNLVYSAWHHWWAKPNDPLGAWQIQVGVFLPNFQHLPT